MERTFIKLFLTSILFGLSACTVAVPSASSLAELVSFSNKSTSPFYQDNLGGILYFNGQCVPGVTGFEFRLNDHPIWTSIPPTSAGMLPDPSEGEYLVGTPEYDLDCSDGIFKFYVFQSFAMENLDDNGATEQPGDPSKIELRAVGVEGLPTIVFNRPTPTHFSIHNYDWNYYGGVEVNKSFKFKIRLETAFGAHTEVGSGQSLTLGVSPVNLTAGAMPAGAIYDSTCTAAATTSDLTMSAGTDEIELCYFATGTTAGHQLQIQVTAPGMIMGTFNVLVMPTDSAIPYLAMNSPSVPMIATLLKGVPYTFQIGVGPYFNAYNSRYVNQFQGTLQITSSIYVQFKEYSVVPGCGNSTWSSAMVTCPNVMGPNQYFMLQVQNEHTDPYIELNLSATPITSCGSNCTINDGGTNYNIDPSGYTNRIHRFRVTEGSTTYDHPAFIPNEPVLRLNECREGIIGAANEDGTLIPPPGSMSFTVSTVGNHVTFYSDSSCSYVYGFTQTYSVYGGGEFRKVYYKLTTMPTNGIVVWDIYDGTDTHSMDFYTKGD